jgi:hypothetical protein
LGNGELLQAAEEAAFEVLITTEKNLATQQNLRGRALAIVVLGNYQGSLNCALTTPSGLSVDRVLLPADAHTRI